MKDKGLFQSSAVIKMCDGYNAQMTPRYKTFPNCYRCSSGKKLPYLFHNVPEINTVLKKLNPQHTLKHPFSKTIYKLPSHLNSDLPSGLIQTNQPEHISGHSFPPKLKQNRESGRNCDT
jgi:hypothetical protein